MHRGLNRWFLILPWAGCLWLVGCSGWGDSKGDEVEESGIAEVADDPEPPAPPPRQHVQAGQPPVDPSVAAVQSTAAIQNALPSVKTPIVKTPIVKTIVQQLRQQTPEGWTSSRSALELTMSITSDEATAAPRTGPLPDARSDGTSYRVEYQRIRLSQELPGQPALTYDSETSPIAVPAAVRPYQGLKHNGFQFRLNRELQLADVVGFEAFLGRCLQSVAPEQRALVHASIPVNSTADGLAFFIDESLGLIPADVSRAGDNWMRSREIAQPVPCTATTRYTLRQVTSEAIDVDMTGTIGPADAASPAGAAVDGVQVVIRGGQLLGQCRIDRHTGLPIRSHIEQSLEMTVRVADGTEFPQIKTTVTTLQTPSAAGETAPIAVIGGERPQPQQRTPQPLTRRDRSAALPR